MGDDGKPFVIGTEYYEIVGETKNLRAAESVIVAADANHDKKVSQSELEAFFGRLDADNDRFASISEMEALWVSLQHSAEGAVHAASEALLLAAYEDESFGVSRENFMRLMTLLDPENEQHISIEKLRQARSEKGGKC